MEIVFLILITLIVYPYLIYPLAMLALGLIRPRKVKRGIYLPTVTILIPAYNEVGYIGATIQNKLNQGYPQDKLQIIVISDASVDGTDDVVASFADQGVILLRREGRKGKAAALNAAVHLARGEILVFSDANSLFGPNALHRLVENFTDPEVGYVTGSLSFIMDNDHLSGDGVNAYMRYENMVRRIETMSGSIVGVNGGIDAIRKDLYVDTPSHLITDLILPLTVIAKKYRVIFDSSVTAVEAPNSEISSEFRMRIRVALRAMQGLAHMRCLLNPLNHPMDSFRLISHKILRYLGFLFMITALLSNAVLAHGSEFYYALLWLQIAIYSLAFLGLLPSLPRWLKQCTTIPSYLLLSNTAFAVATFRFLRGDSMAIWRPRAG
jgi:cellulose synthase/poly-beta-1,6-N-acetylglucosamine synthase-like glycosyltransferase